MNDFSSRLLLVGGDSNSDKELNADKVTLAWPNYQQDEKIELVKLYQKYDYAARVAADKAAQEAKKSTAKVKAVKDEIPDINSQKGELLSLYTESSKLSLKAVINESQRFALVQQQSHDNKQVGWLKLVPGQTFEGFVVSKLNHTSIELVRGDQVIELLMYKRNS
ncbi:hypothetical protein [Shewanella halifaxensis]|uniref:hypothetical protein n=1 Tax=Shewanella halifaxensis TaxID=271098 RepID=UPI0013A66F79|nr:hypothetical protein [Shewanella halifaxensis]